MEMRQAVGQDLMGMRQAVGQDLMEMRQAVGQDLMVIHKTVQQLHAELSQTRDAIWWHEVPKPKLFY